MSENKAALRVDTEAQQKQAAQRAVDETPPSTTSMRPEDLQRARYLTMTSDNSLSIHDEDGDVKGSKKRRKTNKMPHCWVLTSWILTFFIPSFMMRLMGIKDKQVQQAWREKVTLVIIIVCLCVGVGFLTFGFNATVCGQQPHRIKPNGVAENQVIISGRVFDVKHFKHPTPYPGIPGSGDLLEMGYGGRDLSLLFQTVNYNCKGILQPIVKDDAHDNVINYFPCVPINRDQPQKINGTDNPKREGCHVSPKARNALRKLEVVGDIYYNWTDIQKPGTSLVAFNG